MVSPEVLAQRAALAQIMAAEPPYTAVAQAACQNYFESAGATDMWTIDRRIAFEQLSSKLPTSDQSALRDFYENGVEFPRRHGVERWLGRRIFLLGLTELAATPQHAFGVVVEPLR